MDIEIPLASFTIPLTRGHFLLKEVGIGLYTHSKEDYIEKLSSFIFNKKKRRGNLAREWIS